MSASVLLNHDQIQLTIERLSREIIENLDAANTVIIGVQPRGVFLAQAIHQRVEALSGRPISLGKIDETFHRDDFRRGKALNASATEIDFEIEDKTVLLVDDVLYTGRTIRAAMDALLSFGRPRRVELLVLIDRRFNRELPIQPDFTGQVVDTIEPVKVLVEWKQNGAKQDAVIFIND